MYMQPTALLSLVSLVLLPRVFSTQLHAQASLAAADTQQSSTVDSDILFYITDQDTKDQVAVDYSDALTYARSALEPCDEDEIPSVQVTAFMTGDLYDNDLTDVSKLNVRQIPGKHIVVVVDSDDYDDMHETYEDHDELIPIPNPLQVLTKPLDTAKLTWGGKRRTRELDLDEWVAAEVDTEVLVSKDNVPIPAQIVPTKEIVYDLDEDGVFIAGSRQVKTDLDDVQMFYTRDSTQSMVGDLFDNQRTDQVLLRLMVQRPTPDQEPAPIAIAEEVPVFQVTTVEVDIQKQEDADDLDEIDVVFEPRDFDIRPESKGGDLPLMQAYDEYEYMVGDLFDNDRTDAQKLTTVVIEAGLVRLLWEETRKPDERPVKPPKTQEIDVDEVENILVTPISVDFDEEILILTPEPVRDRDELEFVTPLGYLTGDLFNNKRTDSSRLTITENRSRPLSWAVTEQDEASTIYDLQPPEEECESDELSADSSTLPQQSTSLQRTRRVPGAQLEPYDLDDVPTFISQDSSSYLAGDLFDNDRSDSFKLTVLLNRGVEPVLWDSDERSANPGFLQ